MTSQMNTYPCMSNYHVQKKRLQNKGSDILHVKIVLDTKVWNELLFHIIQNILKYLPISMLFKLQIVCKDWNALPTLDHFCNSHIDNHIQPPYFLKFKYEELKNGELYNLNNTKFVEMDFTFILDAIRKVTYNTNLGCSYINVLKAISSNGLLYMALS